MTTKNEKKENKVEDKPTTPLTESKPEAKSQETAVAMAVFFSSRNIKFGHRAGYTAWAEKRGCTAKTLKTLTEWDEFFAAY